MAFWAIVTGYGTATIQVGAAGKPGPWVRMPALISYLNDAVNGHAASEMPAGEWVNIPGQTIFDRSFPVADLADADLVRQHVINTAVEIGASISYPVAADHVIFLPDVKFPVIPEGVPVGVIAVLSDIAPVPSGWALSDGTNGTLNLTDVFRPKDNAVYIQKL